ncbi:alkene reductase [Pseudomonas sp. B28(2017)]|uniref:alkene reductase n=1 Tax=Pseudomonas sp. B28(2017) TaxID=1981730 RepID=UPI000A1F1FE7|nr:alkene reductase [Pseudomonas sp. B28(2017)]
MTSLFQPLQMGALELPHRILMAPMTRGRGTRDHVPTTVMVDYYAQRASAGLIISEAIGISQQGLGWAYATGLWSKEQVTGWKLITDAVHAKGGRIIAQLWHMGRVVHPSFLRGGQPVSASVTTAPGLAHTYAGKQPYIAARALSTEEFPELVEQFQQATRNAIEAGFDGVQVHAANGYLIDQFLRDSGNFRTDSYGGSIDNRIRLLKEVTEAVAEVIGADRTSVRLSPSSYDLGVRDSDPEPLFVRVAQVLSEIGIAHLELREPPLDGTFGASERPPLASIIRQAFKGVLILNSDYDFERAQAAVEAGFADAIAFGRPFIANPDLPKRLRDRLPLSQDDASTWFTQSAEGYTSYPAYETAIA